MPAALEPGATTADVLFVFVGRQRADAGLATELPDRADPPSAGLDSVAPRLLFGYERIRHAQTHMPKQYGDQAPRMSRMLVTCTVHPAAVSIASTSVRDQAQ